MLVALPEAEADVRPLVGHPDLVAQRLRVLEEVARHLGVADAEEGDRVPRAEPQHLEVGLHHRVPWEERNYVDLLC